MQTNLLDQWGRSYTLPGLYEEFPKQFRLIYTGDDGGDSTVIIREPAKWDGLKITLQRDSDQHGVHYEFSDEKTVLEFDSYSGRDLIEAIFAAKGPDALIKLQYGVFYNDELIIEYEGKLNLSTRDATKRKVSCSIERHSLASVVKARWDTPVNLYGTLSLDNEEMPAYYGQYLPLTPQALTEGFSCQVDGGQKAEQTFVGDTNGHVWIQFDTSKPDVAEIDEFASGRPIGFSELEGPLVNDEWLLKFRSSGVRTINIELAYRFWCSVKKRSIGLTKAKIVGYTLNTYLVLKRADGTQQQWSITTPLAEGTGKRPPVAGYGAPDIGITATGKIENLSINTQAGDRLYFYGLFQFGHNLNELGTTQVMMTITTQKISISGQSNNKTTQTLGLPIEESIQSAFQLITSQPDCVRTPYYGRSGDHYSVTGCGALRMLTGGYHLRGFGLEKNGQPKALSISPRDLVLSLQAIDPIGISFLPEVDTLSGEVRDVVVLDHASTFYRDVELLRISSVANYRQKVVASELYSKLEVGYEKWVDEGKGALEECFTKHQIATPLRNEYATKTLTSKLVASSLAIELTRREQFADTPKDSTTYDESVFVIQCVEHQGYTGGFTTIHILNSSIVQVPSFIDWITPGTLIKLSGGPYNGNTMYTVTAIDEQASPWSFKVKEVLSNAVVNAGQIENVQSLAWLPETGADFDQVSGLSSPRTCYNLRLTPGRMLRRQNTLWSGCLMGKPATAIVQPSYQPQNVSVATRLKDGMANCDDPGVVTEKEPVRVDEVTKEVLYRPERISFDARLSWQDIQRLRLAHTGLLPLEQDDNGDPIDRNYGYIVVPNDDGQWIAGYLMSAVWSPVDEKVTLELRRKGIDLDDTSPAGSCSQFAAFNVHSAETALDNDRNLLELCRFGDFDSL